MYCPFCGYRESKVVDSRMSEDAMAIRRRRECLQCKQRFTTYERSERIPLVVIKKDGTREHFDRGKILSGMLKACEKRPVGMEVLEGIMGKIERALQGKGEREVKSSEIGELVMQYLHDLDEVAYVRFASVYRQFKDITDFMKEVKDMLQ